MSPDAQTPAAPSPPSPDAGARIVRGGVLRAGAHILGTIATGLAFVLVFRCLGVEDFGRFSTVVALMAIATGLADAGLTATGLRRFSVAGDVDQRRSFLSALLGVRLMVMPIAVGLTVGFAIVAGYDKEMVVGVLVTGAGGMLVVMATTVVVPLAVELRYVSVAAVELARQLAIAVALAVFVVGGAALGTLFWAYVLGGVAMVALGWALVDRTYRLLPRVDPAAWRSIVHEATPLAIALAINTLYLKILVVIASLVASDRELGLFAAASRVTEVLLGLPAVMVGIAFPLLSHAGAHDEPRLAYALQRLAEVALLVGGLLSVVLVAAAEPIVTVLGGAKYADAGAVLQVQAFALLGASLTQVWVLGVTAVQERRGLVLVNVASLVIAAALGFALIPVWGAIGASAAAVVGESLMATLMVTVLVRARPALRPHLGHLFRYAVVLAAAFAVGLLPVPPLVAGGLAAVVFVGLAWRAGLVPVEVFQALRPRRVGVVPTP